MPSQQPASCGQGRLGSSGGAHAGVLSLGLPGFADRVFLRKKKKKRTQKVPTSSSCRRKSCETCAHTAGFCYLTWNTLCKTDPDGTEVHTFPNPSKKVLIENSSEMTL